MFYKSTRGGESNISFSEAVKRGIAKDGGLFVPDSFPLYTTDDLNDMLSLDYTNLAKKVFSFFADDFSEEEITACVNAAYLSGRFPKEDPAPTVKLNDNTYILELFHGPTCAFKDMALQILPEFMKTGKAKLSDEKETVILTATSGDTGKAALEGFRDAEGIRILVFYPLDGVSEVQKKQMVTQEGGNVKVIAVEGNFDDTQTGVKKIFGDSEFSEAISKDGFELSSANSINWGRLLPQIVYYFHGYLSMVRDGGIKNGDKINVCVPTGNFGDILASYYAMKMGLPVNRIICASNDNKVLTDFFYTGTYDKNREFKTTISPAMDILISSNFERLLFDVTGGDAEAVSGYMKNLSDKGIYTVDTKTAETVKNTFWAGYATEEETRATIKYIYREYSYLADPHTSVGLCVLRKYLEATDDNTPTLDVSTASPFKFNKSVAESIEGSEKLEGMNEFEILDHLSARTGLPVPEPLQNLDKKTVLHKDVCTPDEMPARVAEYLKV